MVIKFHLIKMVIFRSTIDPSLNSTNKLKSLKFPMERARSGIEEKFISPGDTILILLNFYTGNTDFHETAPFGQIPGHY